MGVVDSCPKANTPLSRPRVSTVAVTILLLKLPAASEIGVNGGSTMPRPNSPPTTFVCEFHSLNSHLVKISCVCMIIGLAVGAIAVAEPKPQADPAIPRDELKKLVAAALADRHWARS